MLDTMGADRIEGVTEAETFDNRGDTPMELVAYLANNNVVTDWHGNRLGSYTVKSSWPINSYLSDCMYAVELCVDGVTYVGRSLGVGMAVKGRVKVRR